MQINPLKITEWHSFSDGLALGLGRIFLTTPLKLLVCYEWEVERRSTKIFNILFQLDMCLYTKSQQQLLVHMDFKITWAIGLIIILFDINLLVN